MKTPLSGPRPTLFAFAIVLGFGGVYTFVADRVLPTFGFPPAVTVLGIAASAAVMVAGAMGMVRANRELRAWMSGDHPLARRQLAEAIGPVLAHWTYAPNEWAAYAARERRAEKKDMRMAMVLMAVVVGGVVLLTSVPNWESVLIMGAVFAFSALSYPGALEITRRLDPRGGTPSATLASNAVLFHGRRLYLQDEHSRITGVRYEEGEAPSLFVGVRFRNPRGEVPYEIRVPVPRGREEEARAVAAAFPRPARPIAAPR